MMGSAILDYIFDDETAEGRVLIVDPARELSEPSSWLYAAGFDPREIEDVREGYDLRNYKVVIVSDSHSGCLDFAKRARSEGYRGPILLATESPEKYNGRFYGCLKKPVEGKEMLALVRRAMDFYGD
jgi:hypothetical protein